MNAEDDEDDNYEVDDACMHCIIRTIYVIDSPDVLYGAMLNFYSAFAILSGTPILYDRIHSCAITPLPRWFSISARLSLPLCLSVTQATSSSRKSVPPPLPFHPPPSSSTHKPIPGDL